MRALKRFWTMALVLCFSLADPANGDKLKPKDSADLRVHVLNVGDALCSVVECPGSNKEALMFDCGKVGSDADAMSKTQIKSYLDSVLGDKTVRVVLSHPDNDHVSEVGSIPGKAQIKVVYLGGDSESYPKNTKKWLVNRIVRSGFKTGDSGFVQELKCGDATTDILTVNAGMWLGKDQQKRNADSLVATVGYRNFRAVFPGDADSQTLASILWNLKGNTPLRTSLLVAPHHGSNQNGENGFLWDSVFTPQAVIYSAGNSATNPRCMNIEWTKKTGKPVIDYGKSTAFAYQNTASAPLHIARCNTGKGYPYDEWWTILSLQKQYVTYLSGIVVMTVDQSGKDKIVCLDKEGHVSTC